MTPSALTPAARGTRNKPRPDAPSRSSGARGSGHRSNVRRPTAPTAPRRISGPAGRAGAGGVIAVPAPGRTRPRERTAPPRKGTSPRTRPYRSRRAPRSGGEASWRLRSAAYLHALPDNALLDRIIRGRVWIPLLGMLLAGIVFMQVEVLKLNAGIGRSLERGSALQAQNELLRASVSQLSDEQRIERIAAQMGLVMPGPDQLRFVRPGAGSTQRALGSIHAPDATDFIAQLPAPGAPAAPQGTSVNTGVGLAPGGATSTAATGSTSTADAADTSNTQGTPASPTSEVPTTQAPTTASPTTDAGTTPAGTTSSAGASTPQSAPTVPAAPTTPAGATDQSGSSSSGGAGATPVGG
jgi:hypothetical protein